MQGDGNPRLVPLLEVLPFQHLGHGHEGGEAHHLLEGEALQPLGVVAELKEVGLLPEDLPRLGHVGLGVLPGLLQGEGGRVLERPEGSPIIPVKSPMMRTTLWPSSWNWRIFLRTTAWPRCRSGLVGSAPSLTVRGRPSLSLARSSSSGTISSAPRLRRARASSGVWPVPAMCPSILRPMRTLLFLALAALGLYWYAERYGLAVGYPPSSPSSTGSTRGRRSTPSGSRASTTP